MDRRHFLKGIGIGLALLVTPNCQRDIPYPLEADYYLGLGEKFTSFKEAKAQGHVPYTLGIGKRITEPFDDLSGEETQFVFDMNEAAKRALQELNIEQTDVKETIFYPIRSPFDIIPGEYEEVLWIDYRVGEIEPTYPEIGYQGLGLIYHTPKQIYVISQELYPSGHEMQFPALPWEIANTFFHEALEATPHRNLYSKIKGHYNEVIKE